MVDIFFPVMTTKEPIKTHIQDLGVSRVDVTVGVSAVNL